MIWVDPRDGSKELVIPLRAIGIEVVDDEWLPGGDLKFIGRGEGGSPVTIGIEHKQIADLVSSIRSERLQGHQLLEMRGAKEGALPLYDFAYLLIEGEVLYDARGTLMRRTGRGTYKPMNGKMTINELYKRLNVLHLCGGLNYIFMKTQRESIKWIEALYQTWTYQDFDEHKSHLAIYNPPTLIPPSEFERVVSGLPGVGRKIAKAAEVRFSTIRRALNARTEEWAELVTVDKYGKTRKFGRKAAEKLMEVVG